MLRFFRRVAFWGMIGFFLLLFLGLALTFGGRPTRSIIEENLAPGITYRRWPLSEPRPLLVHTITIDLTQPGIGFLVTPPPQHSSLDFNAQKTSDFLETHSVTAAVNGGFFFPFHSNHPLDFYPHAGDPVNVIGLAVSNGQPISMDYPTWPVVCIRGQDITIRGNGCPSETEQALAGSAIFLKNGQITAAGQADQSDLHPRTAVVLDDQRTTMWLLVIDGRQPGFSEGVSMAELGEIAQGLGGDIALNLDGGGSSTMVTSSRFGSQVRNAPFHTRIPMRERPVANHLGVYGGE